LTQSVSFDQAAEYYDQTRSLPDALMDELVPILVAELPPGRCLEIGIGTGRIALPLQRRGMDVYGVDISMGMLRKLVAKSAASPPPVAIADATRLPFGKATFSSAIASHVLHLIPEWRTALDELTRVLTPGGVLLAARSGDSREPWQREVRRRFFAEAGDRDWPPGIRRMDDVDAEMRARGVEVRKLRDVKNESSASVSELLDALEKGIWSACWSIDEETRRRAAAVTREWARREMGDLDAQRPTRHSTDWRAYVLR